MTTTNTKSIRSRTKHLTVDSIHDWSGRTVRITKCLGITSQRGRNEAVFSVIGVFDGYVGTAFDCELQYHGLAATQSEMDKWRNLGENF